MFHSGALLGVPCHKLGSSFGPLKHFDVVWHKPAVYHQHSPHSISLLKSNILAKLSHGDDCTHVRFFLFKNDHIYIWLVSEIR